MFYTVLNHKGDENMIEAIGKGGDMPNQDLEKEAIRVLSQISFDESKPKFLSFINSAFFVTVIGGLIIGLFTILVQAKIARTNRELQENQESYRLKYKLLTEFSDGITSCLQYSYGMRKREIWLMKVSRLDKAKRDKAVYGDTRSFVETRNYYEKQRDKYNKLRHPDSLCAQVGAIYFSEDVLNAVAELDKIMDEYFETFDPAVLKTCFDNANIKYQDVISKMGKELDANRGGNK